MKVSIRKLIMVCVLIILPVILFLSSIYVDVIPMLVGDFNKYNLGYEFVPILQYAIFVVMLIVYPIFPLFYSVEKYFKKIGPRNVLLEYQNLKKIAFILFPIFIFALFHLIVRNVIGNNPILEMFYLSPTGLVYYLLSIALGSIFFVFASVLLRLIFLIARKDFGYFFAKESLKSLVERKDDNNTLGDLVRGIDVYNTYVRRKTGFEIKKLQNIHSKILSDFNFNIDVLIHDLRKSFEYQDRLKPISTLSKNFDIINSDSFLVKVSFRKKIANYVKWLVTVVSALTATISGLFPYIVSLLSPYWH